MKPKFIILLVLIVSACSRDEKSVPQNSIPGVIKIEKIDFSGKEVTIDWNDVIDADDDLIYYKLYINSVLIEETTVSIGKTILEYNNDYTGKITATDKKGGVSELDFTFKSPKSKILFFSDFGGNLTAYDLITNKILWNKIIPTSQQAFTVHKNLIYTGNEGINGLDILSGELVWSSSPSVNYNYYRSIITDDNNVYAFNSDSDLFCVNQKSGETLWERSFLNYYAPLSMDDSKVYVCSRNDDHLYAVNKDTGNLDWSYKIYESYKIPTNPLIVGDAIYFGSYGSIFYALNKNTGEKIWSKDVGQYNSFSASPTIFNNNIIAGTYRTLYAFDKTNGNIKWSYSPSIGNIDSSPFVYENKVYIGIDQNGSGEFICLDATNGNMKWKYELPNKTTSSPIVYENNVYFGDWAKNFYALNATSGTLNWKITTSEIVTNSPTIAIGNGEIVIYPSLHGLKN